MKPPIPRLGEPAFNLFATRLEKHAANQMIVFHLYEKVYSQSQAAWIAAMAHRVNSLMPDIYAVARVSMQFNLQPLPVELRLLGVKSRGRSSPGSSEQSSCTESAQKDVM